MTESNSLQVLFKNDKNGLTLDQFVTKYNELKVQEQSNQNTSSIFKEGMSLSIEEIFKTLDVNHDNVIDNVEIQNLREYNNDNDNNENITESDLNELYGRTIKRLEANFTSNDPKEIYEQAQKIASANPDYKPKYDEPPALSVISGQLSAIKSLMEGRQNASDSKIQRFQNELDNLITTQSNLSKKDKRTYANNCAELNTLNSKLKKDQSELKQKQEEMERIKSEIEYLKAHNADNNKDKIDELNTKYNQLSSDCAKLSQSISGTNKKISEITEQQKQLVSTAKMNNANFEERKNYLIQSINNEKNSLEADMQNYRSQVSTLEDAEQYAISANAETYPASQYEDEDTSNFSYDSKELQNKWRAKWTKELGASKAEAKISKLGGDAFFNKVCAVAQRLHCDANALMGVMNSESGVDPSRGNAAGGSAVGLIQFMPQTASQLGTSSAALKSMSAVEQLNYVEKMINYSKKIGGISQDQPLDSATLYTLVFLPAYAKRDVLTVKGHKFYNANSGLDKDGDGRITKADMRRRVQQFMA